MPCSASRPLPRPLLCRLGVRPRAVCAHTPLTSPCAVREMRLQGEGGAGVCVRGERTEQRRNKRGGVRSICRRGVGLGLPLFFSCAHIYILHAPTPTPPLASLTSPPLSLSLSPLLSLCRVGISGRAPSSTPCGIGAASSRRDAARRSSVFVPRLLTHRHTSCRRGFALGGSLPSWRMLEPFACQPTSHRLLSAFSSYPPVELLFSRDSYCLTAWTMPHDVGRMYGASLPNTRLECIGRCLSRWLECRRGTGRCHTCPPSTSD